MIPPLWLGAGVTSLEKMTDDVWAPPARILIRRIWFWRPLPVFRVAYAYTKGCPDAIWGCSATPSNPCSPEVATLVTVKNSVSEPVVGSRTRISPVNRSA
jgi:hypothetical protein